MLSDGTVTVSADDYNSLFAEEMAAGSYDAVAWYNDAEGSRYTEENKTEVLTSTDNLSAPALKFVLYKTAEPEPEPTPDPEPSRPSSGGSSHSYKLTPKPEPEPVYETLACGKAVIDRDSVVYLTDALKRFTAAQERLTRGRFAALLYGVLSDESRLKCDRIAVYGYDDMYGSPYEDAVAALTGAGVFCGDCGRCHFPLNCPLRNMPIFKTMLCHFNESLNVAVFQKVIDPNHSVRLVFGLLRVFLFFHEFLEYLSGQGGVRFKLGENILIFHNKFLHVVL